MYRQLATSIRELQTQQIVGSSTVRYKLINDWQLWNEHENSANEQLRNPIHLKFTLPNWQPASFHRKWWEKKVEIQFWSQNISHSLHGDTIFNRHCYRKFTEENKHNQLSNKRKTRAIYPTGYLMWWKQMVITFLHRTRLERKCRT